MSILRVGAGVSALYTPPLCETQMGQHEEQTPQMTEAPDEPDEPVETVEAVEPAPEPKPKAKKGRKSQE